MSNRHNRSPSLRAHLAVSLGAGAVIAAAIWRNTRTNAVGALRLLASPLIVPIDDPLGRVSAFGESHPAAPQLAAGRLIVPVENAGLGPAINITGRLVAAPGGESASIPVLAPGGRAALVFGARESLADFELQLAFKDLTGRSRRVTASWSLEERSYRLSW